MVTYSALLIWVRFLIKCYHKLPSWFFNITWWISQVWRNPDFTQYFHLFLSLFIILYILSVVFTYIVILTSSPKNLKRIKLIKTNGWGSWFTDLPRTVLYCGTTEILKSTLSSSYLKKRNLVFLGCQPNYILWQDKSTLNIKISKKRKREG